MTFSGFHDRERMPELAKERRNRVFPPILPSATNFQTR
jgi:hypothetical protein